MSRLLVKVAALCFCLLVGFATADIPAHCLYEQILGTWYFLKGPSGFDNTINCANDFKVTEAMQITLQEPDIAIDKDGNVGFFTIIYDQGFEVVINNQKYFAFFSYEVNPITGNVTSFCHETSNGWYHDSPAGPGILPTNWGCYKGKNAAPSKSVNPTTSYNLRNSQIPHSSVWKEDIEFVNQINQAQSSWTAKVNPNFVGKSIQELQKRAGTVVHPVRLQDKKRARPTTAADLKIMESLPTNFDWRNVSGVNYDSPMRDQLNCGSCYAHATAEMLEDRTRILTNNQDQVLLSPQVVVSCSQYSQGCNGGFTYLVSKYGEDFGLVTEQCFPYQSGLNPSVSCSQCCQDPSQKRYVTDYKYVGGFYGNCSEVAMMLELYQNGPIAVAFEVYPDLKNYHGGIYHHVTGLVGVNPWEITNHEVIIVGWGVEPTTGEKFWIVRNSWGYSFGEGGYFRIRKGTDECSIESSAYAATPVLNH